MYLHLHRCESKGMRQNDLLTSAPVELSWVKEIHKLKNNMYLKASLTFKLWVASGNNTFCYAWVVKLLKSKSKYKEGHILKNMKPLFVMPLSLLPNFNVTSILLWECRVGHLLMDPWQASMSVEFMNVKHFVH